MASKVHRRHSSVDTLGWMYTNRVDKPPAAAAAAALDRSASTRMASFRHEVFPALKRQSSLRFNPGEYFAGCFGPRETPSDGAVSTTAAAAAAAAGPRRNGHSRSKSTSFLSNFGLGGKIPEEIPHRVLQQPAGRWVREDDEEYYLKPPAWKQALRKLQAEARRHVQPAPPRERLDYDVESYQKNFDNGALPSSLVIEEEDEFEVKARLLHTRLLMKLDSKRFEKEHAELPPVKLLKSVSVPAVPVRPPNDGGVRIWERRVAHRPLTKLELTRSI